VVIAIIAILASLLLPSLSRAKELGRTTVCKNNLRQIGLILQMYVGDTQKYPGWTFGPTSFDPSGRGPGRLGWISAVKEYANLTVGTNPYLRGFIQTPEASILSC